MQAEYNGQIYEIGAVNFREQLLGLLDVAEDLDENARTWVRCENAQVLPCPEGLPNV